MIMNQKIFVGHARVNLLGANSATETKQPAAAGSHPLCCLWYQFQLGAADSYVRTNIYSHYSYSTYFSGSYRARLDSTNLQTCGTTSISDQSKSKLRKLEADSRPRMLEGPRKAKERLTVGFFL